MKMKFTANEHNVLLAMAYIYGISANSDQITAFAKCLFDSPRICAQTLARLVSQGYVVRDSRFPYNYPASMTLRRGLFVPLLKELLSDEHSGELAVLKKRYEQVYGARPVSEELRYASRLFDERLRQTMTSIEPPKRLADDLAFVLGDKDYEDIFSVIPDDSFLSILKDFGGKALVNDDDVDWEYLHKLIEDKPKRNFFGNDFILSCFNYFYYLGTGKMCTNIKELPMNAYSLSTAAIVLMYRGDYESAYKFFTKAMTAHNKLTMDEKNFFFNDVTNYYYMMCLLLANTDKSLKKFDTFNNKVQKRYELYPFFLFDSLHCYFREHRNISFDNKELKRAVYDIGEPAISWLIWMILSKLGIWPKDVKQPRLTEHPPKAAWLRAELNNTGVIPKSDDAATLFGGTSLFSRLEIKELWQLRLEEIINESSEASKSGDPSGLEQPARVVYILSYGEIEIVYQKRKKNGDWSVGRHIDARQLKSLKDPWLDDTDMRFMKRLDAWTWHIDISDHIADLVGCDHVFADNDCIMPVNIHEDKPFLVINKRKDGTFIAKANPEDITKEMTEPFLFKKNSETDYAIYRPSAYERRVYKEIVSQKEYPASAEPLLQKLIATIGGRTEVHSNMVVDDDELKKVNASSKIILRCMPSSGNNYSFTPMVRAFGSMLFVPGKGAVTTIAEENGKRVQVVRKLRKERENMKAVCDELANIGYIDDDDELAQTSITDTYEIGVAELLPLLDWVKENPNVCEMEWPENARVKYHPVLNTRGVSINITSKNGWFDVEGDIRIDDKQVISLQRMLELMHNSDRSKYIRIGDQEYVTLSRDLSKILKRLDTVTSDRRNHLQMSTAAVGLIGDVLDNKDINLTRSKAVDEIRKRIEKSAKLEPKVPKALHADLRDYQEAGFEWMSRTTSWGAGVCLADDMGLGKTVQTIALLLEQQKEGPSLIVAPASVVPNWRNELRRFAPTLGVTVLNDAEDRKEAINGAKAGDVVVTTYALLNNEQEDLVAKEWNVVCLDEAHTIKNPNTKMSKAAMQLQAKRKVELTGTPIQNHLSELWNLFQFINPGLLGSFEQFTKKFIMPVEVDHNKERQGQLKRLISPFLLRRTKGEVIEELPEKDEIVVPVELSSDEMTMYEVHRRETVEAVKSSKAVKVSTLAEITRLRQMACSCSLVDKKWKRTSSKVEAFIDLAENLNESGNRALVFSQFTSFFAEVRKAMDKAKLPYLYLDGSTPMKQREKIVAEFQKGDCPFFLISLKAGGLGLNLTGANYVIHLDPWWNPAIEQQATDRAYRIGQKQDVTVYHLISQHTIEEKILRLHKTKRDLADSLLEGTDMSHALTQEELLELLK